MTITIGRVSLASPKSWSVDVSGRVSASGLIISRSAALNRFTAEQVRNLANGQGIVPVTWSANSDADGYYQIIGGSVSPIDALDVGWSWQLELALLPNGFKLPVIESILQGGYRPNTVGVAKQSNAANTHTVAVVDPLAWWSFPSAAVELGPTEAGTFVTANDVTRVTGWPGGYQTQVVRWSITAANYYSGACQIEQLVDSSWESVVGRQTIITDPTNLRISNGYMGVKFDDTSGNDYAGLQFFGFGRTAGVLNWTAQGTFMQWGFTQSGGDWSSKPIIRALSVLRNDPEEVRIRITASASTARGAFYLDVSLRRGADHVTVVYVADAHGFYTKGGWQFDVASSAIPITDVLTYGAYRTSTSGSIQPWVLCTLPVNTDNANGLLDPNASLSPGDVSAWGLGPVYEAYVDNADNGSAMRWFAPFTERQRIVGR